MKRIVLFFLLMTGVAAYSQNIQLHYDFGENRKFFTSTVEMFKPDTFGSTFFFIDIDYGGTNKNEATLGYFEIARDFKFWKAPLTAHIEFNGGNLVIPEATGISLPNNWLFGAAYTFFIGKSSLTTQLLYKSFSYGSDGPDFQWTNVFFVPMLDYKLIFTGFIDVWTQDKIPGGDEKNIILLTEPQLWYNVYKDFSIGGELEISKNFVAGSTDFEFMPTLGVKYNF
ncbi:MAG: DUF5020 family protein [Bacteroidota bacterium]